MALGLSSSEVASDLRAIVRNFLSAVETHLIGPAGKREWPAEIAVPATKEKLEA
jgi:hypothetical protein